MFQAGPCGPLLDHEGIHLFDAALSELNLTMLGVLRRKPSARSSVAQPVSRARHLAYRWKQDRAARRLAHLSLPPAATDILFWPRNTTHTVVLAPVMKAMVARGVRCRILACQPRTLREAHDRNVDVTLTQAVWPRELRAARRDAAARAKALNRLAPWTLPDFAGHAAAQIEPVVRYTLTRMLETVYESATSLRAALAAMHPKAVVVGNDLTAEGRVACRVAAQQGTATAVLMHGTITGIPLNARHGADRIFVFGDAHRRELIEMGIAPERIVVSGDPNLDSRPRQSGHIHPDLQARLGLRDGEPWILVTTSGPGHRISHEHHEQVVASLNRLAAALPGVPLVIKLHPKDRLAYYEPLRARYAPAGNVHVIPRGTEGFPANIYQWLNGATMILTGASTTAIEAMVMEVPVITMDFCNALHGIDFIEAGATLHVTNADDLEAAVRNVLSAGQLSDDRRDRIAGFLRDTYYALDGRASERIGESLCQLAGLNQTS